MRIVRSGRDRGREGRETHLFVELHDALGEGMVTPGFERLLVKMGVEPVVVHEEGVRVAVVRH